METLLQDVRYAARTLARSPGYTLVALLTLALGIGMAAAMFAIVNGVLLRPLPYPAPGELVRVYQASPEQSVLQSEISPVDFEDWAEQSRSFQGIAGYWSGVNTLTGRGDASEVRTSYVTADFFSLLGTPVQLGRPLNAEDHGQSSPVVVISDGLWRSRFGADPDLVGDAIQLGGLPFTVVGIAAPTFRYPASDTEVWLPHSLLTPASHGLRVRNNRYLSAVARLAPGVSLQQARAELASITARIAAENPATSEGWGAATVLPLREVMVGDVDRALFLVLGVVAFVLLIGCANLANLMLARSSGRSREIAIRTALGAGGGRIVRQLSTEALVLALLGGALGLGLSLWFVEAMIALSADTLPRVQDIRIDLRVIAFGVGVAVLTSLLFGLLPALRVARMAPQESLRGGRGTISTSGGRLRGALVVAEVALAVLLVVGAGLMVRSFMALRAVDPGFDPEHVLNVALSLNGAQGLSPEDETLYTIQRKEDLVSRIEALPGVVAAGVIHRLPLRGEGEAIEFTRSGSAPGEAGVRADTRFVSPGYFRAMGIPLQSGELVPDRPTSEIPPVLLSEATARRLWPGEEALGRRMLAPWGGELMVVGIVGDVRQVDLTAEPQPAVYLSQFNAPRQSTNVVVRTASDPLALAGAIRAIVAEIDPDQPVRSISTISEIMSESVARDRFFTLLFGIFGGLALVLAAIGIYGVLSYSVGQRTREFGVRMALGARAADVLRMVVASGMALVGVGVVIGLIAALALTRVMAGLLFGVSHTDLVTFVAVPAILVSVALAASLVPAYRATRVDPMTALRNE